MDTKEFTKHLLDHPKIDEDEIIEWAVWRVVYKAIDFAPREERREYIMKVLNKEIDKWL